MDYLIHLEKENRYMGASQSYQNLIGITIVLVMGIIISMVANGFLVAMTSSIWYTSHSEGLS
jgi:hypothetical protein